MGCCWYTDNCHIKLRRVWSIWLQITACGNMQSFHVINISFFGQCCHLLAHLQYLVTWRALAPLSPPGQSWHVVDVGLLVLESWNCRTKRPPCLTVQPALLMGYTGGLRLFLFLWPAVLHVINAEVWSCCTFFSLYVFCLHSDLCNLCVCQSLTEWW